jgi:phage FluMu protein Com
MYRLSRGYGSEVCTIGYVTLGKLCNVTRNTVKSAVKSLIASGWIECLEQGAGADHSTYKVNLPLAAVAKSGTPKIGRQRVGTPNSTMPNDGMAANEGGESITGMPAIAGIPVDGPIKETDNTKEITHTTQAVRVGSRFSMEECRRYAEHLHNTGQGITNPGGYATKIFRSGEADAFIDAFLNPQAQLDISKCPACRGSNFVYIDSSNPDRGVKPCKHIELLTQNP